MIRGWFEPPWAARRTLLAFSNIMIQYAAPTPQHVGLLILKVTFGKIR